MSLEPKHVDCPLCRGYGEVRVSRSSVSCAAATNIIGKRMDFVVIDDVLDASQLGLRVAHDKFMGAATRAGSLVPISYSATHKDTFDVTKIFRTPNAFYNDAFQYLRSTPTSWCKKACPLCAGWRQIDSTLSAAFALLASGKDSNARSIESLRESGLLPTPPSRCVIKNMRRSLRRIPVKRLVVWGETRLG